MDNIDFQVIISLILIIFVLLVIRIKCCLPNDNKGNNNNNNKKKNYKTLIIFGSGGHTSEMLQLIKNLNNNNLYNPCYYILANTDKTSENKIKSMNISLTNNAKWIYIQRSREVKQSYITTIFTTLISFFESLLLLIQLKPEVIICNGPGTCVPLCYAAFIFKVFGYFTYIKIIFVESFCRVETLSLTGKLLYYISDLFIVQWPHLINKYPKAKYIGVIC